MIIQPEQLITDLITENEKLKADLLKAEQEIHNFEVLAVEWKKGYYDCQYRLSTQITNLEQTIEELKNEIEGLERQARQDSRN